MTPRPCPLLVVILWSCLPIVPTLAARPAAAPNPALRQRMVDELRRAGVEEIVFVLRHPGREGHWYANFSYYAESADRKAYGEGGKLCRLNLATGQARVILDDPKGEVRDPVVHYDARKILFAYRKGAEEHFHLYEINLDGSGLRQLTFGAFDDFEPCYLPDDRIVFVSSRCKRWVNCWLTQVATLHRCDADGRNIREISANIEQDNTPWPLPDGRVLYQRWEYIDRSQVHYHHLWTANPDGTGQMVYYGNQQPGVVMIDAKPIPGTGQVIAVFSPGHGARDHNGRLAVVDPRRGPDDAASSRTIAGETNWRDPWAFSSTLFMAAQHRRIALLDASGAAAEIYRVSAADEAAGLECHEPRPVVVRPRERVIPDRTNLSRDTGTLVLMDVYRGRNMAGVRRGEIKKLLVLETLPKPLNYTGGMEPLTYGGSFTLERVLGAVPVEPDGSAHIDLPALRSVFFVALDENDMSVKRMQSFLTVQPGETTGCIGCHEQRTETFAARGDLMALRRPPSRIAPVADCPDVFDFPRDIQPILDKLCVDCHGYEKTARGGPYDGAVTLTGDRGPMYSHAYFTMTVRRLFSDGRNRPASNLPPRAIGSSASRILKMIDGSHYNVRADERQRKVLRLWIEAGAPYPGTYAALGCGSIGGYYENVQDKSDRQWPTAQAGAETIQRRCANCHTGDMVLPKALSDERGVSFWKFALDDPRLRLSRHVVFNLSRPEQSLLVLAPLARRSGGLELCRNAQGKPEATFADTADADYRKLVAMAAAGRQRLEEIKRFDMPDFRPTPQYLREMKRYGILPLDHQDTAPVNVYELDRRYWQSLWYMPPGDKGSSWGRLPTCPEGTAGWQPAPRELPSLGNNSSTEVTAEQVARLRQQGFPMIDFHIHLKGGLTLDEALAESRRMGIRYGIVPNCGVGFPITDDRGIDAFLKQMAGRPAFIGMQAEGREWPRLFSKEAIARFDYVFTDAMTIVDHRGRRARLWMNEEVDIPDADAFMERLVRTTVDILTNEPIDIYVNPTFLPEVIAKDYDKLWTLERQQKVIDAAAKSGVALEISNRYRLPKPEFIKKARLAGIKFTFGTNNADRKLGRCEYGIEMIRECGLVPQDMWLPKPKGQKPVEVRGKQG